ncbi:hypothetical protein Rrhod_2030 [Rhodococcus rhodnii LMG 5362]|uniref:Uncharacterized protein n=1 Tax=Rhodococcus rhodnii LMG 5362 TaxID=1273125 RepID=R7WMV6_9NOCA|nr:hypothetical protein Rrhod_2030 [Rhodococcus rhodnii LMG 5362]
MIRAVPVSSVPPHASARGGPSRSCVSSHCVAVTRALSSLRVVW